MKINLNNIRYDVGTKNSLYIKAIKSFLEKLHNTYHHLIKKKTINYGPTKYLIIAY